MTKEWTTKVPMDKPPKRKKSVVGILILLLCIFSLIVAGGYAGCLYYKVHSAYSEIWDVSVTIEDIGRERLQKEGIQEQLVNTAQQIDNYRNEYENSQNALNWHQNEENRKQELLQIYERNIQIVDESKKIILESFGYVVEVDYSQTEDGKQWRNDVIDQLSGNALAGSAIQGGLDAAEQNASLESIMDGVKNGLVQGVPSFAADIVKDKLADKVGGGLVDAGSILADLLLGEKVPEGLANHMASMQDFYVGHLTDFIEKENISVKDLRRAADYYYQMSMIGQQASAGDSTQSDAEIEEVYQRLRSLAEEYQVNNTYLSLYVGEKE